MDKKQFRRSLLPIGLLLISARFIIAECMHLPDFLSGFMAGLGITLIIASYTLGWYKPRKA